MGVIIRDLIMVAMAICLISVANAAQGTATFYTPPYVRSLTEMGVVVGGQCSQDRRGDRCGDRHGDRCLVGLVVLTWWPVSGFGGRRLVDWFAGFGGLYGVDYGLLRCGGGSMGGGDRREGQLLFGKWIADEILTKRYGLRKP
ncbi:eg45-like domain containing protein [Quercus suber]|uniref:Eg45-like domain containing protein n=1 Tax=Quercus suber TaxID=58331 RepID=A0AAW0LVQ6_QUESU